MLHPKARMSELHQNIVRIVRLATYNVNPRQTSEFHSTLGLDLFPLSGPVISDPAIGLRRSGRFDFYIYVLFVLYVDIVNKFVSLKRGPAAKCELLI